MTCCIHISGVPGPVRGIGGPSPQAMMPPMAQAPGTIMTLVKKLYITVIPVGGPGTFNLPPAGPPPGGLPPPGTIYISLNCYSDNYYAIDHLIDCKLKWIPGFNCVI